MTFIWLEAQTMLYTCYFTEQPRKNRFDQSEARGGESRSHMKRTACSLSRLEFGFSYGYRARDGKQMPNFVMQP